jgi:hypothetical protein
VGVAVRRIYGRPVTPPPWPGLTRPPSAPASAGAKDSSARRRSPARRPAMVE